MSEQTLNQNQETEVANVTENAEVVVRQNEEFKVVKTNEGYKKERVTDYEEIWTFEPQDKKEKLMVFNLLNGDEESGNGLKDHIGEIIPVANIITKPYRAIDEGNGNDKFGVLTYIITPDNVGYVTSSKSVFFTIQQMLKDFGNPSEWDGIQLKVGKVKRPNGDMITVKPV